MHASVRTGVLIVYIICLNWCKKLSSCRGSGAGASAWRDQTNTEHRQFMERPAGLFTIRYMHFGRGSVRSNRNTVDPLLACPNVTASPWRSNNQNKPQRGYLCSFVEKKMSAAPTQRQAITCLALLVTRVLSPKFLPTDLAATDIQIL